MINHRNRSQCWYSSGKKPNCYGPTLYTTVIHRCILRFCFPRFSLAADRRIFSSTVKISCSQQITTLTKCPPQSPLNMPPLQFFKIKKTKSPGNTCPVCMFEKRVRVKSLRIWRKIENVFGAQFAFIRKFLTILSVYICTYSIVTFCGGSFPNSTREQHDPLLVLFMIPRLILYLNITFGNKSTLPYTFFSFESIVLFTLITNLQKSCTAQLDI